MIRRSLRFLLHFAAGCLLVGAVIVAFACVLLNQEVAEQRKVDDPLSGTGVSVRSSNVHHALRPGSVIEHPLVDGTINRVPINSFGLRGPEPVVPKPANTYRIVMLGDETIFAPNLRESETAAFQLQSLLQQATRHQVEVVNAAVPGYCPLLSLLQFRHNLAGLHADLIVLNYDMSDPSDDRRYRSSLRSDSDGFSLSCSHPALMGGIPDEKSGPIGRFAIGRWLVGRLSEPRGSQNLTQRYAWLRPGAFDEWKASANSSLGPVVELSQMARQLSVRFILTGTPVSPDRIGGLDQETTLESVWREPDQLLAEFAEKQQIEYCRPFSTAPDPSDLLSETGLSRRGHQALAVELAAQVRGLNSAPYRQETKVQQVSGKRQNRM